ncbi:hypothetical protein [Glaciimonas sp. PCH181]|uniref:hypothetical protein n=1 Tax=Glaciimonas sp. PCH181 TaxID=2133943 RepID=UPI000D3A1B84|nr:hypothetical protein [Glaciimonas sp. PCH181]PUA18640.1 hypothetical protein C7W93_01485 [Glaciimonas sp. PCH181]
MATNTPTPDADDGKLSSQKQSVPSTTKDEAKPPAQHILHEVSVEADGSEDPGAGIEQMVESKKESGSSLLHTDAAENAPSSSPKKSD